MRIQPALRKNMSGPILKWLSPRGNLLRSNTLIAAIGITILSPLALAQDSCGLPIAGTDQWSVAAPESVGLSSAVLCPMVKWLNASKESNVHAVLVARRGSLVLEQY